MALAAVWVEGQGMHLAANSIDNLIENLAGRQVVDLLGTDIYRLTYFLDEDLSHILWHIGIIGLAVLLMYRDGRRPSGIATAWWAIIVGGVIYGFTLFCIFLEGQTVALGLPFVSIVTLLGLIWWRKRLADRPVLAFFFVTCVVATTLFLGWVSYWGGFPEFSEVGLL
jgi:hypothetical protein